MNLQLAHDIVIYGLIFPGLMYFVGRYVHTKICYNQPKYHWYLMVFYNPDQNKFHKIYRGFKKNQISLRNIMYIKHYYHLHPDYVLLNVSYLGYMESSEFGDHETLHSLNIEIQTHG